MFSPFAFQAIRNGVARFDLRKPAAVQNDNSIDSSNTFESQASANQQVCAPPADDPAEHNDSRFILNVSMAQKYCDDDEENSSVFTLDELEGWAALRKEYQHDRFKQITPHFQQVPEILNLLQALIAGHRPS
ncbi:hypothetical protein M436DRAFT_79532 [Aureobasidium namibiae CBS 147.97]|uniref:Uncharacterized protein n=1 Tax=Aureobasidium namibiae CBS 147.97 TaxID=1043004 RepID=A0A074X2Q1_9PEZI